MLILVSFSFSRVGIRISSDVRCQDKVEISCPKSTQDGGLNGAVPLCQVSHSDAAGRVKYISAAYKLLFTHLVTLPFRHL